MGWFSCRRALLLALLVCGRPAWAGEAALPLQIVTADLPPFAIAGHPARPGLHVEVIEEVLRRAGSPAKVGFYPWARAIALPRVTARTAVLPLTRTAEREHQFTWLLKLDTQQFVFINRHGDKPVASLEQARKLRIVVLRGSPNLEQLTRREFDPSNILQATSVEDMVKLVERGIADALYGSSAINLEKIRSSGRDAAAFQVGMAVESADIWLAGGKGFKPGEAAAWQQAYDAMAKDGALARIYRTYNMPLH